MKDNRYELFPIVDEEGHFLGTISRGHAHDGCKILHPVVHLHVINDNGYIYLQRRPEWKDIQPGKWDTACGGHVDLDEHIDDALRREVKEEIGISDFVPEFVTRYAYESTTEYELVNVYLCHYRGTIVPDHDELDGGRYWSIHEIEQAIGNGVLTPNFESEYVTYLQPYLVHHKRK